MSRFSLEELAQFASCERDPTPQETIALLDEYSRSMDKIRSADTIEKYDHKWVAAFDGELVAKSDGLTTLLENLRRQAIPPAFAAIWFVSAEND